MQLGSVVRQFNDLAVPGMGGAWYGKQLLLATAGVVLAERARRHAVQASNIEVANALEALACMTAFKATDWAYDSRLLGRQKLRDKSDSAFSRVRRHGFYVTQPMRMRTVQPLLALGLVQARGERFNAFESTQVGQQFVELAFEDFRPRNRDVLSTLMRWVQGDNEDLNSKQLRAALSPLNPLPKKARIFLRECLVRSTSPTGATERRNGLAWMDDLSGTPGQTIIWGKKPAQIDTLHWQHMRAGARFFVTRDAALAVLDLVEAHMAIADQRFSLQNKIPHAIEQVIEQLRGRAKQFQAENHDPSPNLEAGRFCREVRNESSAALLAGLVKRDGRILQLRADFVCAGAAFSDTAASGAIPNDDTSQESSEPVTQHQVDWPDGMSGRVQNLYWFNLDLNGKLDQALRNLGDLEGALNG